MGGNNSRMLSLKTRIDEAREMAALPLPASPKELTEEAPVTGNSSRMPSLEARIEEAKNNRVSPPSTSRAESPKERHATNNKDGKMFSFEERIDEVMELPPSPAPPVMETCSGASIMSASFTQETSFQCDDMPMAKACAMPMTQSVRPTLSEPSEGVMEPRLYRHLSERLEPLTSHLALASPGNTRRLNQRTVDELLDDLTAFFIPYATEKRALVRLAQTGRVVQQLEGFHRSLDALMARCGLASSDWKPRWRRERILRLAFFRKLLSDELRAGRGLGPTTDEEKQELLMLLKYNASKFEDALTANELALLHRAVVVVMGSESVSESASAAFMARLPLPEWFVAPCEKAKQQRKWQRAGVAVRSAPKELSSRRCLALADTWSRLRHPHVIKLFGACHVGHDRFFVVADGTPLTWRLGQRGFPLWRAMHEAALGLHFLHERRVVLDALSCSDLVLVRSAGRESVVLAGFKLRALGSTTAWDGGPEAEGDPLMDGSDNNSDDDSDREGDYAVEDPVADLTRQSDSLLSLEDFDERGAAPKSRATRDAWQSPELLKGGSSPTVASDIFALGMCVFEAFSGGNVWSGSTVYPTENPRVSGQPSRYDDGCGQSALLMGRLPPRPEALKDERKWALVQRMCAFHPEDRPGLDEVLASFQEFAESGISDVCIGKTPRGPLMQTKQPPATMQEVSSSLTEVQAWCDAAPESSALNFQLCERLEDVAARLTVKVSMGADQHANDPLLRPLVSLITRFRDSMLHNASDKQILRLAASRQVVDTNAALHHELDLIMDKLELDRENVNVHSWKEKQATHSDRLWERMRASLSGDSEALSAGLSGEQERTLLGAYLSFEASQRNTSYSPSDLKLLKTALKKVTTPGSLLSVPFQGPNASLELPLWFLPPYEVVFNELDAFSRGAFGSVHFGKWLATPVVVKKVLTPEEQGVTAPLPGRGKGAKPQPERSELTEETYRLFLSEVNIWFALNHPHVVKLFGACHVGAHQFFVCEYASLGSLNNYLSSQPNDKRDACVWRLIHEAALGLQHLHEKNIVHADLKCNNILVGAHGVAKLTDFGLSSIHKRRLNGQLGSSGSGGGAVGAYRWKAPEVLSGQSATFASDVYSFVMCIIEAVSGEFPWGLQLPDAAVRFHVRKGRLPPRPKGCFSDRQWDLVERMSCHEPSQRLTIAVVVDLLAAML